jgi:single-strand DNA-binding protein
MNLNKIFICGNLTRLPEMKALPSGKSVSSSSIATNRVWTDTQGQKPSDALFHNVVAFGKQAEILNQYCTTGSLLIIEGRLQTRSWEKDGQKQYRTEVVVESFQLGPKREQSDDQPSTNTEPVVPEDEINPDEIPF